jgi:hypothetical protein
MMHNGLDLKHPVTWHRSIICRISKSKPFAGFTMFCLYIFIIAVWKPVSAISKVKPNRIQINRPNFIWYPSSESLLPAQQNLDQFQNCSIQRLLGTGLSFLDSASPLPVNEFIQRQDNLAKALVADQLDAFIAEPGYTFQYYTNISQTDWEVWEPEERPFLMIIQPYKEPNTGDIHASARFLAPKFEVERVRLLHMPFDKSLDIVPWEEHWNPYETLRNSWKSYVTPETDNQSRNTAVRVMVDEEMRDFIQRGLGENGFEVVGLGGEVQKVRQTKSLREIEILKAVNTGTVEGLRAMRECMYAGLTENDVAEVLDSTLRAAGLEPFFDIVLFGRLQSIEGVYMSETMV